MRGMSKLKQMIKNELEKDKTLATKLAKIAGYKNPTPLYKFLNESDREVQNFNSLVKIVRELFQDREFEIMNEYCRTLDPNKKAARIALEYATINNLEELKKYLIEKLTGAKNIESKDFAFIYDIYTRLSNGEIPSSEGIQLINRKGFTSYEAQLFSKIVLMYQYYFKLELFDNVLELVNLIKPELDEINDQYLEEQYKIRINLMLTAVYLHKGMLQESRDHAYSILKCNNIPNYTEVTAYLNLGNSFIMENYDKSLEYLKKGLDLAIKYNLENSITQLKGSLNFLMNYWGKEPSYLTIDSQEISDIHEIAFMHIRKGNKDEALNLLNKINQDDMSDWQKGFHYFYRGLIDNNKENYYKSITYFKLTGDQFYRQLPLIELKKLRENEVLLNALSV
jgi:hypothetical protein